MNMKKKGFVFLSLGLSCLFLMAVSFDARLGAQEKVQTAHYEITVENGAKIAGNLLAKEMELRFNVYNRLFRFDPSGLAAPLKVRLFTDQAGYDDYVRARLGTAKAGAVYLHYTNAERRELVIFRGREEDRAILAHQAFVQFLRAFVPNPPSWIREGFAIYFNTLTFNPGEETLSYEENLAWLESIKKAPKDRPSLQAVISADLEGSPEIPQFQIFSWAVVSFFLNNGRDDYFRTLTECFMTLSPAAPARENALAVRKHITLWNDPETMERDYLSYLEARKTFTELMEEGRGAYRAGDLLSAELSFMSALDQRPSHYAPWYYLGLILYDEKNYPMAEEYYKKSLEFGADEALVSYALGLNAISDGRNDDAAAWLEKASAADPARYKTRAADLLRRLK
jgi:tetratricopeptide (TPR) repeat protein